MKNKAFAALFVAMAFSGGSAQAHVLDLTAFTPNVGINGGASVSSNVAYLSATASLSGVVSGLTSFEWRFQTTDYLPYNDYSYVSFNGGTPITLSDVATVGNYGNSGWQTYNTATPFSGTVTFGVNNFMDNAVSSNLSVQNVTAVPEPEEYAMMMAGIPLVGWQIRRKQNKSAPVVA